MGLMQNNDSQLSVIKKVACHFSKRNATVAFFLPYPSRKCSKPTRADASDRFSIDRRMGCPSICSRGQIAAIICAFEWPD